MKNKQKEEPVTHRKKSEYTPSLLGLISEELTEEELFYLQYPTPLTEEDDWALFVKTLYPSDASNNEEGKPLFKELKRQIRRLQKELGIL